MWFVSAMPNQVCRGCDGQAVNSNRGGLIRPRQVAGESVEVADAPPAHVRRAFLGLADADIQHESANDGWRVWPFAGSNCS